MKNNQNKNIKKKEKSKDKNLIQKISNIDGKLLTFLKENWDKIEIEYDSLIKKSKKFNDYFKEQDIKKEYESLILLFSNFKNNFKNIFFNVGINLANISTTDNEKINNSYDNVYNEMACLESIIKDINTIQNNNKKNKKIKIQNLENKLHQYMDEIENFDFDKIEKYYDLYNNFDKNDLEKIILKNDFIEQYNNKDVVINKGSYENDLLNLLNINTLNHDSDNIK